MLAQQRAGPLQLFWGFELYHRDDLPFDPARRGFNTYSSFRRTVEERCRVRPPLPPADLRRSKAAEWAGFSRAPLPSVEELIGADAAAAFRPPADAPAELRWKGGETAALERVDEYIFQSESLGLDYVGATMTTDASKSTMRDKAMSKFSPWLAHGCVSARLLYAEVQRYERERRKNKSTYWIVHELCWRDFVRFGTLHAGSSVFKLGGLENKQPRWDWSQDRKLLDTWIAGLTGFPFIDAFMRELKSTGYCNHMGRETAGWFLICDLGIDWRMGAEWFEHVLLDFEPAANYFNWAYRCLPAIGKQMPPKTRLQTIEVLHWGAQHDPDAQWIKRWIPELRSLPGTVAREPWRLGLQDRRPEVSPEALAAVVAMGFSEAAANRALLSCGGNDVEQAVALLVAGADAPSEGRRCGQCNTAGLGGSVAGDGVWYCNSCWAAWEGGGIDNEDELLAQAIELSLADNPRTGTRTQTSPRASPRSGAVFRYGVDYPFPVIQPVSLKDTESIEETARREQAKRDRQIADTRLRLGSRRGGGGGKGAGRGGPGNWEKARWEDARGSRGAAVAAGVTGLRTQHAPEQAGAAARSTPPRSISSAAGYPAETAASKKEAEMIVEDADEASQLSPQQGSSPSTGFAKRRRWGGGEPASPLQGG